MTRAEKTELVIIPLVGITVFLFGERLPLLIGVGSMLITASALLLLQGLLRDLWLLSKSKTVQQSGEQQKAFCICLESTVGSTGIVAGFIILGSNLNMPVLISPLLWGFLAGAVLTTGFIIKAFIVELRPFRIRRAKDHLNIIFSWPR
jgi:hypothetical protein